MKKLNALLILILGLLLFPQLAQAQNTFLADAKIKITSTIAANNTTAIVLKATSGTVYSVDAFNNSAAIAYIKLYNAASATCGSGTPQARYMIPFGASSSGGGVYISNNNCCTFRACIVIFITTPISHAD